MTVPGLRPSKVQAPGWAGSLAETNCELAGSGYETTTLCAVSASLFWMVIV